MSGSWKLATFNIESFDMHAGGEELSSRRIASLRPAILRTGADILCLQEVNAQGGGQGKKRRLDALSRLIETTGYAGYHMAHSVNPRTGLPSDVHNLVILSRWPIVRQQQLFHDLMPSWRAPIPGAEGHAPVEIRFDRPILAVEIARPGRPVHVLNLHLRAPRAAPFAASGSGGRWAGNADWAKGFYIAALKRQGQALEARLHVDSIFDRDADALIAVCGDLNADSFETPARILRGAPDDPPVPSTQLQPRVLEILDLRIEPGRRHSVIHDGRHVMLDHILASPGLACACTGVEAFNEGLADEAHVEGEIAGSLHAAVVATFAD